MCFGCLFSDVNYSSSEDATGQAASGSEEGKHSWDHNSANRNHSHQLAITPSSWQDACTFSDFIVI